MHYPIATMEDCLRHLFPPTVKFLRGTSAVWQHGSTVYKYATPQTVNVHLRELETIANVPPRFADEVGLVAATAVPYDCQIMKHAPPTIAKDAEYKIIKMPVAAGVEAYEIVTHSGFPQVAVAAAAVAHCRRVAELGYANTDVKLENILVSADKITFVVWGGICRLGAPPPHRTYVVTDHSGLNALETMKVHLTMLIGEMGSLYVGEPLPKNAGVLIKWSDVIMARRFCEKVLEPDTLALYKDFMGATAIEST